MKDDGVTFDGARQSPRPGRQQAAQAETFPQQRPVPDPSAILDASDRLARLEAAVANGQALLDKLSARTQADRADIEMLATRAAANRADIDALLRTSNDAKRLNRMEAMNVAYRADLTALVRATANAQPLVRERVERLAGLLEAYQIDLDALIAGDRKGVHPMLKERLERLSRLDAMNIVFSVDFEGLIQALGDIVDPEIQHRLGQLATVAETYFVDFDALLSASRDHSSQRSTRLTALGIEYRAGLDALSETLADGDPLIRERLARLQILSNTYAVDLTALIEGSLDGQPEAAERLERLDALTAVYQADFDALKAAFADGAHPSISDRLAKLEAMAEAYQADFGALLENSSERRHTERIERLEAQVAANRSDIDALTRGTSDRARGRLDRLEKVNKAYRASFDILRAAVAGDPMLRERAERVQALIEESQPDFDALLSAERVGEPMAQDRVDRLVASGESYQVDFDALRAAVTESADRSIQERLERIDAMAEAYFVDFAALLEANGALQQAKRIEALEARVNLNSNRLVSIEASREDDRVMLEELRSDGLLLRQHGEQMEQALTTSRRIGAAVGIIMATRHISEEEAFKALVAASHRTHTKLRAVAGQVVEGTQANRRD